MSRAVLFVVVVAVVIAASFLMLRSDQDEPPDMIETKPAGLQGSDSIPTPDPDPFAAAQAEYADAKERLRGALDEQTAETDPELFEPVEENLGFLEKAVVEVMMALSENPENNSLRQTLLHIYEEQVNLLQKALRLTSNSD